jgi:hypothetical protein
MPRAPLGQKEYVGERHTRGSSQCVEMHYRDIAGEMSGDIERCADRSRDREFAHMCDLVGCYSFLVDGDTVAAAGVLCDDVDRRRGVDPLCSV